MRSADSKHRCLVHSGSDEVLFCVCITSLGIHLQRTDIYRSTERFIRHLNLNTLRTGSFKLFKRPFPGLFNNFNPLNAELNAICYLLA